MDDVSLSNDSSHGDFDPDDDNFSQPVPDLPAGVDVDSSDDSDDDQNPDDDSSHSNDENSHHSNDDSNLTDSCDETNNSNEDEMIHGDDNEGDADADDLQQPPQINIPDKVISSPPASPPESPCKNTGVGHENAGVGAENTGVGEQDPTSQDLSQSMDSWYGTRTHDINLRDHKPRSYSHCYGPEHLLTTFEQPMGKCS